MAIWNEFLVGTDNDGIVINSPRVTLPMTKEKALLLAAWLIVIADPTQRKIQDVIAAVLDEGPE